MVVYGFPTLLFVMGGASLILLVDGSLTALSSILLSACLAVWWRNIFYYYHQKEQYRILMIPQTALWFIPVGFFLAMSGLSGLAIFFGMPVVQLLIFSFAIWVVSLSSIISFFKVEWSSVRAASLILSACFLELTYVTYLLSQTFFVKATLHTFFFILAGFLVRSNIQQPKTVRLLVRLGMVCVGLLAVVLVSARWK